jgi:anti-sigma regulatory factor (Ser/Thr protein kinase)
VGFVPEPDIEAKIAGREPPRGWGVFLIRNLVDEVQFDAKAGGGHEIRMVIHLDRKPSSVGSQCDDAPGSDGTA